MEQDTSDQPIRPAGVMSVHLADGRTLRLAVDLDARIAVGRWVSADGAEGAVDRVHLGQDLAWYLRGVHDGLVERSSPSGPAATVSTSPSPATVPPSASPSP